MILYQNKEGYNMIHITRGLIPFWDDYMIDHRFTDAVLSVNKPEKKDVVLVFDKPWEGHGTGYITMIREADKYRMYYEVWAPFDPNYTDGINVCYAESTDGIHWEKPNLGICEFHGSTDNNIILRRIEDNFTVMRDDNPDCPPEHRYKATLYSADPNDALTDLAKVVGSETKNSLVCMVSADGIHFKEHSVISRGYAYDTLNSLHWNPHTKKYYCYIRDFHVNPVNPLSNKNEKEVRGIRVMESEDFENWTEPQPLNFMGGEDYPLYTNCIMAYPGDTRYYVGWPSRYVERKEWTANYDRLCGAEKRKERMTRHPRLGLTVTDCVFMSSRDNVNWYRFDEACITPGPEMGTNWIYGDCYPAMGGLIETPSAFPGEPNELSVYADFDRWHPLPVKMVRYVYRMDGFASVKATYKPQTLHTKPFTFEGETLKLNFRTSARGGITLRILDERNVPIEGYTTCEIFGDSIDRIVDFDKPLAELQGKVISFSFTMSDAEIYAMKLE